MKAQGNKLYVAFCLSLMLAMTIVVIPNAFGVVKISTSCVVDIKPWDVGVGQNCLVQGLLYPPADYSQSFNITITAPNGTKLVFPQTVSGTPKEAWFVFKPDVVGNWGLRMDYGGDDNYGSSSVVFRGHREGARNFTVSAISQPVPPVDRPTDSFVGTVPKDKVGVGDSIYIVGWTSPPRELQGGIYHVQFDFAITKPDGTVDHVFKDSDSAATASFSYACTQAGSYSVVLKFPGDDHLLPMLRQLPSTSPAASWIVEAGYKAAQYPNVELPSANFQWKYPISMESYEWYQLAGAWPYVEYDASQSYWNQYTTAPNTPHVIWRMQTSLAGIMGGDQGYLGFSGSTPDFVAWQGRLWALSTIPGTPTTGTTVPSTYPVLQCYDEFTGKLIYQTVLPGTGSAGTLQLELSARQKIDPRQSEAIPQTTSVWAYGSSGLRLMNPFTGACTYWNRALTNIVKYYDGTFYSVTVNSTDGHSYLSSWDTGSRTDNWVGVDLGTSYRIGDYIDTTQNPPVWVRAAVDYGGWPIQTKISSWNAKTGAPIVVGQNIPTLQVPEGNPQREAVAWGKIYMHGQDLKVHAVSIYTGKEVWVSDKAQIYPWGDFNAYNVALGYNIVYFNSWDGHVYGYDATTGKEVMNVYSADAYQETAMGTYPFWGHTLVADGKIYSTTGQHTRPNPYPRGDSLVAANAFTGEKIWQLFGFSEGGSYQISSGVMTYGNTYDGCVYAFSKGPTEVTVNVSPKTVANGAAVLIEGTVTDQSPGSPDTPAISDADQAEWVRYLYMNRPKPANATGVTVFLQAINVADGTLIDLWHVTSDNLGRYEYAWTPPATGTYKILATFEGSGAYYASSAETPVLVMGAATPIATPTPTPVSTPTPTPVATASPSPAPQPDAGPSTDIYIIAAAVVVVIVVVAVAAVFLRKRK